MTLSEARKQIDSIDKEMKELFLKRMQIVQEIAIFKKENGLAIYDEKREKELKVRLFENMEKFLPEYQEFIEKLLEISKKAQEKE